VSVTGTNLVMGPAELYIGAFGATEPADTAVATAPSSAAWTDLGGTLGGLTVNWAQEFAVLAADQIVDRAGSRMSSREFTAQTQMAEPTLENLVYAINGGTITSGSGFKKYTPGFTITATQPTYRALLIDGWAPGTSNQLRRRLIVRKILSTAAVGVAYSKDGQSVLPVTFTGHYVDGSIAPWVVVDATP
jgi:hypothetical protein